MNQLVEIQRIRFDRHLDFQFPVAEQNLFQIRDFSVQLERRLTGLQDGFFEFDFIGRKFDVGVFDAVGQRKIGGCNSTRGSPDRSRSVPSAEFVGNVLVERHVEVGSGEIVGLARGPQPREVVEKQRIPNYRRIDLLE